MRPVSRLKFLLDRTAVLFIGLATGAVIAFSFFTPTQAGFASRMTAPPGAPPAALRTGVTPAATPAVADQPFGSNLQAAISQGRTIQVGVFGDSFGDGIWAALYRQLPHEGGQFDVHQFSQRSTGFTRYRSLNVLDDIRGKIDRQPVDIAVISFGANDTQGIYDDGHGYDYMSDGWRRVVAQRVAAVIQLLRERGAMVYWVGLPRMRSAEFDDQIQQMNAFYAQQMAALHVPFIETLPRTVDANGQYSPYLRNPETGEPTNARANDGIHMTMNGYGFLTHDMAARLRGQIAQARLAAGHAPVQNASNQNGHETRSHG